MLDNLHSLLGTVLRAAPSYQDSVTTQPWPNPNDSYSSITNCSWYGPYGNDFSYSGTALTFTNNLIAYNDWSVDNDDGHTGMGSVVLQSFADLMIESEELRLLATVWFLHQKTTQLSRYITGLQNPRNTNAHL